MSLTPEEMFYLATGLVDVNSWTDDDVHHHSRTAQRCNTAAGCRLPRVSRVEEEEESSRRNKPRRTTCHCCSSSSLSSHNNTTTTSTCSSSTAAAGCGLTSRRTTSTTTTTTSSWRTIALTVLIVLFAFSLRVAEGCSSRSTPKPRPPPPPPSPTPAVRPNITFQTYACPPAYATYYCLNGATCFTIKIGESILYNCECTEGYMGQRCEYKDLEGSYLPLREKIMLERASIAGGATVAVILVVILSIIFYTYVRQRRKEQRLSAVQVSVEKLERRSRTLSLCSNTAGGVGVVAGGCRCGAGTVTNTMKTAGLSSGSSTSFLLLQPFSLGAATAAVAAGGNQGNQAKLVQVDARYAYPYRSTDYAAAATETPNAGSEARRDHITVSLSASELSKPTVTVH